MTKATDLPQKEGIYSAIAPIPVKAYSLKVALYEGIELPSLEKENVAVIVCCGPYEVCSNFVKCEESRAIWDQELELKIRGPESPEDISDVILYLATDPVDCLERVTYNRIKAASLLDSAGKAYTIENYVLEEDRSLDRLDDEEFPGILQARIKLYSTNPTDELKGEALFPDRELNYTEYLLQVHLYIGRNLPPADESGAADPFVVVRCQGQRDSTEPKFETLNPAWFESVELLVSLPPIGDSRVSHYN